MIDSLTIKRFAIDLPTFENTYTSEEMNLLNVFLDCDAALFILYEDEIKEDLKKNRIDTFSFKMTRLFIKDSYFCLKYQDFIEGSEIYDEINLFALQSEIFKLVEEYFKIIDEDKWKKIEVTFDGELFAIKVLEEFE